MSMMALVAILFVEMELLNLEKTVMMEPSMDCHDIVMHNVLLLFLFLPYVEMELLKLESSVIMVSTMVNHDIVTPSVLQSSPLFLSVGMEL